MASIYESFSIQKVWTKGPFILMWDIPSLTRKWQTSVHLLILHVKKAMNVINWRSFLQFIKLSTWHCMCHSTVPPPTKGLDITCPADWLIKIWGRQDIHKHLNTRLNLKCFISKSFTFVKFPSCTRANLLDAYIICNSGLHPRKRQHVVTFIINEKWPSIFYTSKFKITPISFL